LSVGSLYIQYADSGLTPQREQAWNAAEIHAGSFSIGDFGDWMLIRARHHIFPRTEHR
jgi:hypothetical protein